ncbi:MAG: winged helix-turn-helix domain-containing protein [Gammaproteobacteria bacterium]|nr:winged helix-turn-helix domain-containing protein [Gammaproteobacteria bacterium]MDH4255242.1 winged helix-turn-helix domain-containing protein [Gammaproteobacteria bacterium]MDH5310053.1 winged helix-turn-helix domain-containing protein [Gammaproteobacteria bacterium]
MSGRCDHIVRFGDFEMDTAALELKRDGQRLRLQIQPFRVLQVLVENAGRPVSREEFRQRLWPSNVCVDFDHGLNNAIARVREALGDSSGEPRYIETLPRVGYRFVCPLHLTDAKLPAPDIPPPVRLTDRRSLAGIAASLAAILLAILAHEIAPTAAPTDIRSVAVLPFRDLSGELNQQYFAEGLTDALVTRLAQNSNLRVVSRRSAEIAADGGKSLQNIATELGVEGIIESSFVLQDDDIRIDVQLIRVADDSHARARSYLRRLDNLFSLQAEIASDIALEIAAIIELPDDGGRSASLTSSIEAWDLYQQGRHLFGQRNPDAVAKSIEYYRLAIGVDPRFAAAWAGIAESYAALGGTTLVQAVPPGEVRGAALHAAHRALELDPRLAQAHASLGQVLHKLFPRAPDSDASIESAYRTALAMNPAYATARHWYGNYLSSRRRGEEAIAMYREALLLDPLNPNIIGRLGLELLNTGAAEEGLRLMQKSAELEPWQLDTQIRLGWSYAALDRLDEARQAFGVADRISRDNPHVLAGQAYIDALAGDRDGALQALVRLAPRAESMGAPFLVAIVYVGLKDRDNALLWLGKASGTTDTLGGRGLYSLESAIYDWLREDQRFDEIRLAALGDEPAQNC